MKRFLYVISPTGFEAVMYVILSITLLVAGSYKQIFQQIENNRPDEAFNVSIQFNPAQFGEMFQQQNWLAIASTAFFWSMVGLVLSFVGWIAINTLIDFYNTYVVATNFMHPRHFEQISWWGDYILRLLLRIAAGTALIFYTFILVRFLYPAFLEFFKNVINEITDYTQWPMGVAAIVGWAISMHVMVVLFRFLAMKSRLLDNR